MFNDTLLLAYTLLLDMLFAILVKTTLLFALTFAAARLLRRASAAVRHFLWRLAFMVVTVSLAATLLLPVFSLLVDTPRMPPLVSVPLWQEPDALRRTLPDQPYLSVIYPAASPAQRIVNTRRLDPAGKFSTAAPVATWRNGLLLAVAGTLWLGGALWHLARLRARWRAARVLEQHSQAIEDARVSAIARRVADQMQLPITPHLLEQTHRSGLFSPMMWISSGQARVLLPHAALDWLDVQIEAVLRHEFAHVRRGDWTAVRRVERLCALLWFNPLVWRAARQMQAAAEQACDDMTVSGGTQPSMYAQQLLDIAQQLKSAPAMPQTGLPFLSRAPLETRLRAILNVRANRKPLPEPVQKLFVVLGALCVLPAALVVPTVARTIRESTLVVRARHYTATLPNGVTVEVIGVSRRDFAIRSWPPKPYLPELWWSPDGTPLGIHTPGQGGMGFWGGSKPSYGYILHLRVTGLNDTHLSTAARVDVNTPRGQEEILPFSCGAANNQPKEVGPPYTKLLDVDVFVPDGVERCTLRLGIANGPWTDVPSTMRALVQHRALGSTLNDKAAIHDHRYGRNSSYNLIMRIQDNEGNTAKRVIGYTRAGKAVRLFIGGVGTDYPSGKMHSDAYLPPATQFDDFTRFQVQTCRCEWMLIPDIALQPRR